MLGEIQPIVSKGDINKCHFVDIPTFCGQRGNLSVVQNDNAIVPFKIERLYYITKVPEGQERAGDGHKRLRQLFFAASGSCELSIDDDLNKRTVVLDNPHMGFYICPGIWQTLTNFPQPAPSVCLHPTCIARKTISDRIPIFVNTPSAFTYRILRDEDYIS